MKRNKNNNKIGFLMSLMLCATNSLILSLVGFIFAGQRRADNLIIAFFTMFGLSLIICMIVNIIHYKKHDFMLGNKVIVEKLDRKGWDEFSVKGLAAKGLVNVLIYLLPCVLCYTTAFCAISTKAMNFEIDKLRQQQSELQSQVEIYKQSVEDDPGTADVQHGRELMGKIEGIDQTIAAMELRKPHWVSLFFCTYGLSFILTMLVSIFLTPLYLRAIEIAFDTVDDVLIVDERKALQEQREKQEKNKEAER